MECGASTGGYQVCIHSSAYLSLINQLCLVRFNLLSAGVVALTALGM